MYKAAKEIYASCQEDVCLYEGLKSEQRRLMCSAVADLAEECEGEGDNLPVDWRSEGFCSEYICVIFHENKRSIITVTKIN